MCVFGLCVCDADRETETDRLTVPLSLAWCSPTRHARYCPGQGWVQGENWVLSDIFVIFFITSHLLHLVKISMYLEKTRPQIKRFNLPYLGEGVW